VWGGCADTEFLQIFLIPSISHDDIYKKSESRTVGLTFCNVYSAQSKQTRGFTRSSVPYDVMQDSSEHKLYTGFQGYLNADFQFHCNLKLSNTSFQSTERQMSEQVLNWFSSIQFLETTYSRHAGLLRGGFCVFDVINIIALSAQFFGRNTPAIFSCIFHPCDLLPIFHSCIFHSRIFSAPAGSHHSGDFLQALSITSRGLKLDDEAVTVAVGTRLALKLCVPHQCRCDSEVDSFGRHSLVCKQVLGRTVGHHHLNYVIARSLCLSRRPVF